MKYRRILLKISGESLGGVDAPLDEGAFSRTAKSVADMIQGGVQVCLIVGGGNLFRGVQAPDWRIAADDGDLAGMAATGVNAQLLSAVLRGQQLVDAPVLGNGPCSGLSDLGDLHDACTSMRHGAVPVLAGGFGVPGTSTDVPAVEFARRLRVDGLLIAKYGTDGIYTADPNVSRSARLIREIGAADAASRSLGVMDREALDLLSRSPFSAHVFSAKDPSAPLRICRGESVGSVLVGRTPRAARDRQYPPTRGNAMGSGSLSAHSTASPS